MGWYHSVLLLHSFQIIHEINVIPFIIPHSYPHTILKVHSKKKTPVKFTKNSIEIIAVKIFCNKDSNNVYAQLGIVICQHYFKMFCA